MKRIICTVLVIATIFFSCNSEKSVSVIETISLQSPLSERASNLFKEIKIVPLETTDSSLIVCIVRIEVWDDKIFVLNLPKMDHNLFCFDLNGKFLFAIDRLGQGPGEYTALFDFIVDKNLNHLVSVNGVRRYMHFDLQGNFLYDVHADDTYYSRHFVYLNDSTYMDFNDGELEPKDVSLVYLDPKTMNIKYMSNSINEFEYNMGNHPISVSNNNVLCLAYSDSIYDISDRNNVYVKYFLYSTEQQIRNKKQFRQSIKNMDDMQKGQTVMQNYYDGEIFVSAIHENDKYLAVSCSKFINATKTSANYIVFYDKADKKAYNSVNIDFDGFKLNNCAIKGAGNQTFYCVLSEISEEDKEQIKNSSAFSEADKQKLLAHKYDDNPMLLLLK